MADSTSPSHHLNLPPYDDDDVHDNGAAEEDGDGAHADEDVPTEDAIIDVLAHLHPRPESSTPVPAATTSNTGVTIAEGSAKAASLKGWTKPQLRDEVLRLRRLLTSSNPTTPDIHGGSPGGPTLSDIDPNLEGGSGITKATVDGTGDPTEAESSSLAGKGKRKRKIKEEAVRDGETGKRVERSRRTELAKALRNKMRFSMGITEKDPLPAPTTYGTDGTDSSADMSGYGVPNWLNPGDAGNTIWVERMAGEIIQEHEEGSHQNIPSEDLDAEIVKAASRTAFINFCRKYQTDNDPEGAAKRVKYQKGRRRWARKDLKQKKRAKAALDPTFTSLLPSLLHSHPTPSLPPSALHLDYMSSEYSSPGPSTSPSDAAGDEIADPDMTLSDFRAAKTAERTRKWAEEVARKVAALGPSAGGRVGGEGGDALEGGGGLGLGDGLGLIGAAQGEKVLEIRCPRWRSKQLEDLYTALDKIAAAQALRRTGSNPNAHPHPNGNPNPNLNPPGTLTDSQGKKSGHIAPAHSRFRMRGLASRRGKVPKAGPGGGGPGDPDSLGWMWDSGVVGVWPVIRREGDGNDENGAGGGGAVGGLGMGLRGSAGSGGMSGMGGMAGVGGMSGLSGMSGLEGLSADTLDLHEVNTLRDLERLHGLHGLTETEIEGHEWKDGGGGGSGGDEPDEEEDDAEAGDGEAEEGGEEEDGGGASGVISHKGNGGREDGEAGNGGGGTDGGTDGGSGVGGDGDHVELGHGHGHNHGSTETGALVDALVGMVDSDPASP